MGDIGKRIRFFRESKGMSQEELAKRCGYKSKVSICKIELERDAPIKKLVPIAEALGITPQELMGWTSDDPGINEIADVIANHEQGMSLQERQIIEAYRNADDLTQQMVLRLLKVGE